MTSEPAFRGEGERTYAVSRPSPFIFEIKMEVRMRMSLSILLIGLLVAPSVALADPSLAIMKQKPNRTRDVVLANDDGSGQYVIYNSKERSAYVRAGGPRSGHMLLLVESTKASLLNYRIGAKGPVFASIKALPISVGYTADLSPDGSSVAYYDTVSNSYRLYQLIDGSSTPLASLPSGYRSDVVVFTRDGASVLYSFRSVATNLPEYYTVPVTGGPSVSVPVSGKLINQETALDGGFLLERTTGGVGSSSIERFPQSGGSGTYLAPGARPSLNCTDSSVFFQLSSLGAPTRVLRLDLATGSTFDVGSGYYAPAYLKPC